MTTSPALDISCLLLASHFQPGKQEPQHSNHSSYHPLLQLLFSTSPTPNPTHPPSPPSGEPHHQYTVHTTS